MVCVYRPITRCRIARGEPSSPATLLRTLALLPFAAVLAAASYTLHTTGNVADVITPISGGLVLAGGGSDVDSAMRWMIKRSGGGDVVVLRASGADGYNGYLHARLGGVDSVQTIVFASKAASSDPVVLDIIAKAEAIFMAGGDQSSYLAYWKDTPVETVINQRAAQGVPVGGTSAGLAVLGEFVYAARFGSATSAEVLADPYHRDLTLERAFLVMPGLGALITDSHFSQRDRMGRLCAFLGRLQKDGWTATAKGLGIDEATALCIDTTTGQGTVHGGASSKVIALRTSAPPAIVQPGVPLTLRAIETVELPRNAVFDLRAWSAVSGAGPSYRQSVVAGVLTRDPPATP